MGFFIFYAIMASATFAGTYYLFAYKQYKEDCVFGSVMTAIFWIVTIWFIVPYAAITLLKDR